MCANCVHQTFLILQPMFIKSVTQTQFEAFKKRRNAGRKTIFFKTALRSLLPSWCFGFCYG